MDAQSSMPSTPFCYRNRVAQRKYLPMALDPTIEDHIARQFLERDVALRDKFQADCRECRHALRTDVQAIQLCVATEATDRRSLTTTLDEMKGSLNQISKQIQTFDTAMATQRVKDEAVEKRLSDMNHVVYGNGEPGLKGHVNSLLESRANVRWGIGIAWGTIVGIAAAVAKLAYGGK